MMSPSAFHSALENGYAKDGLGEPPRQDHGKVLRVGRLDFRQVPQMALNSLQVMLYSLSRLRQCAGLFAP